MDNDSPLIQIPSPDQNGIIHWTFPHKDWSPNDFLCLNRLDFSPCRGCKLKIDGKSPLWLYMFCGVRAASAGAVRIIVCQAEPGSGVCVWPLPETAVKPFPDAAEIQHLDTGLLLEYNGSGNLHFEPENLAALLRHIPRQNEESSLILSGSMPNYLAVAAILQAWRNGWTQISYWSPILSGVHLLWPEIRCLDEIKSTVDNRIIGIVGDPNSGKSVFAKMLETAGKSAGRKIWTFDCDYAAPTPRWYLRMIQSGMEGPGTELRKQYKRHWTPEGERQIADVLKNLKHHFPLVIADLPGGKHPQGVFPENAQRIPPGREILMTPVDYFIIIARKDRDSKRLWTDALARHGLQNRIILTVWSESPDAMPELEVLNDKEIRITGLSRGQALSEKLYKNLWQIVQQALSQAGFLQQ